MNRVQQDYFENLLYKVFVTIDGQMNVKELSDIIGISEFKLEMKIRVFSWSSEKMGFGYFSRFWIF